MNYYSLLLNIRNDFQLANRETEKEREREEKSDRFESVVWRATAWMKAHRFECLCGSGIALESDSTVCHRWQRAFAMGQCLSTRTIRSNHAKMNSNVDWIRKIFSQMFGFRCDIRYPTHCSWNLSGVCAYVCLHFCFPAKFLFARKHTHTRAHTYIVLVSFQLIY